MVLTEQQRRAATLLASGQTVDGAAMMVGVSSRTLARWKLHPDFVEEQERIKKTVDRVQAHVTLARLPKANMTEVLAPALNLAEELWKDLPELIEARRHGIAMLKEAMTGALASEDYGAFAKLLQFVSDRTGLIPVKQLESADLFDRMPLDELRDHVKRLMSGEPVHDATGNVASDSSDEEDEDLL